MRATSEHAREENDFDCSPLLGGQVEGVCFSADRSHISFLRTVNIAQRGTFKFCPLSLLNSHLEQNTRPWREPGPLTCGPATGHISKYEGKCVGQVRGACVRAHLIRSWMEAGDLQRNPYVPLRQTSPDEH